MYIYKNVIISKNTGMSYLIVELIPFFLLVHELSI